MRGVVIQRAAVLLAAALAVVWLGIRYAEARTIERTEETLVDRGASPAQLESALGDVRATGTLDPGTGAERLSYVAAFQLRLRRPQDALATLEEVVRREPDAAEPWLLIFQLTRRSDPRRSAQARAQLLRLNPLISRARLR